MNIFKRILFNQDGYIGKAKKAQWAHEASSKKYTTLQDRIDMGDPDAINMSNNIKRMSQYLDGPAYDGPEGNLAGGDGNPWTGTGETHVSEGLGDDGAFQPNQGFDNANKYVMEHLAGLAGSGTASMSALQESKINARSGIIKSAFADRSEDDDDLPVGPGSSYMNHLFRYNGIGKKLKEMKKGLKGVNIYTDQMEALMTALSVVGVYSDKNAGGMPIDMQEALKLKFGDGDVDETDKAQFMTMIEQGDTKIDPKRVRKFVNYDGSLTWEILNDDKTVMSRFTMGKYKGTSIFAQGGYKKFAELLKTAKQKLGKDSGGEFDSIRSMFGE